MHEAYKSSSSVSYGWAGCTNRQVPALEKKWFFFHVKTLFLTWTEQSRQVRYEVSPDYLNDDEEVTALTGEGAQGSG